MPFEQITNPTFRHKCDRCGVEVISEESHLLGWATLITTGGVSTAAWSGYLCTRCADGRVVVRLEPTGRNGFGEVLSQWRIEALSPEPESCGAPIEATPLFRGGNCCLPKGHTGGHVTPAFSK